MQCASVLSTFRQNENVISLEVSICYCGLKEVQKLILGPCYMNHVTINTVLEISMEIPPPYS